MQPVDKSPARLGRYLARAGQLLRQPGAAVRLAGEAAAKLDSNGERLAGVRRELVTMVAMLRAWARGEYRGVSSSALLSIAAGVLYFVSPFDAVPDFLFGFGFVDDVAVIGYVLKQVRSELQAFASWQTAQRAAQRAAQGAAQNAPHSAEPSAVQPQVSADDLPHQD